MSDIAPTKSSDPAQRPEFRNLNLFADIRTYRMPIAGWVSILHRVSGALLFVLLPFIIWMFDVSVASQWSFSRFVYIFNSGIGPFPSWFIRLVSLAIIWGYLHHFCAGVRHLWMDATHSVTKKFGQNSAIVVLAVSLLLTVVLAIKLFIGF